MEAITFSQLFGYVSNHSLKNREILSESVQEKLLRSVTSRLIQ